MADDKVSHTKHTTHNFIDLTGQKFGRLTVIRRAEHGTGRARWLCQCECGNRKTVIAKYLRNGETRSCGCLRVDTIAKINYTHGKARTPEFRIWMGIKSRCLNPRHSAYSSYGGRGIFISGEWRDDFMRFLADMGPRPSKRHSVERINNDGPYSKDNCRWATWHEQVRNTRKNIFTTEDGIEMIPTDAAILRGLNPGTIRSRISRGWSVDRALSVPIFDRGQKPSKWAY